MKRQILVGLISVAVLGGCVSQPRKLSLAELEEQARGYDSTARTLQKDTEDPQLASALRDNERERERLQQTIRELESRQQITPEQGQRLNEAHEALHSLHLRRVEAILGIYHEVNVDFLHLNNATLLPEVRQRLESRDWSRICPAPDAVLVYGYGDPIGGEIPTQKVSEGRADTVARWLQGNTPCRTGRIVARGLGVDVKAEDIEQSDLPQEEKLRLYVKSRYARVLIPKSEAEKREPAGEQPAPVKLLRDMVNKAKTVLEETGAPRPAPVPAAPGTEPTTHSDDEFTSTVQGPQNPETVTDVLRGLMDKSKETLDGGSAGGAGK